MSSYTSAPVRAELATVDGTTTELPAPAATEVPAPPHVECADPTGAVPWPTVLIEGGPKSGKSIEVAQFTGDARFSAAFWLELGMEGTGNWYKLVPGSRYKLLTHDGRFAQIRRRIAEVHAYAQWAVDNGLPPVLFVVDTVGALWLMIQAWVDWKARQTTEAKKKLAQNPHADIQAPINVRNQGKALWDEFLISINSIPGVKILISRGQEVTKFENGQPTTQKSWSVVGHRELGFDVNIWARLQRGAPAELVAVHHPVNGIDAMAKNEHERIARQDFSLGWLVFDRYGLDPANAYVREMHNTNDVRLVDPAAVAEPDDQRQQQQFDDDTILAAAQLWEEARKATTRAQFKPLWEEARDKSWGQVPLIDGSHTRPLLDLLKDEAKRIGELERQAKAGEPDVPSTPKQQQEAAPRRRPEILELLTELEVIEADWWVMVSGIAGRPVKGLHDITGEPRQVAVEELRNLAALAGEGDTGPLIASHLAEGERLLGRGPRVQDVA